MSVTYNTYNTDYEKAMEVYVKMEEEVSKNEWEKRSLIAAAQIAGNLALLKYQGDKYDEIEDKKVKFISSAQSGLESCLDNLMDAVKDASDRIPQPAMYQPVSVDGEILDNVSTMNEIMGTLAENSSLISEYHTQQDMAAQVMANPKYYEIKNVVWMSIEELVRGSIPIGETVQTMKRTAENCISNGTVGPRSSARFYKDLGITDYSIQKAARQERREEIANFSQYVNPLSRRGDTRDYVMKPPERLQLALQQAQLIQNSMQNAFNLCAKAQPYLLVQLQIRLQKCIQRMELEAGKAGLVKGFVPNYAGIFSQQIGDLANGLITGVTGGSSGAGSAQSSSGGGAPFFNQTQSGGAVDRKSGK